MKYSLHMDDIDRKILAELQEDGRLTVTELADRVQLTAAPCHRRLRELERTGVITGYRAVLDPAAVGLGFEALVSVTLDRGDAATVAAFETAPWEAEPLKTALDAVGAERGLRLGKAQAPVRVAVTGRSVGLPLFESLEVLGRERTLARLRAALSRLAG